MEMDVLTPGRQMLAALSTEMDLSAEFAQANVRILQMQAVTTHAIGLKPSVEG